MYFKLIIILNLFVLLHAQEREIINYTTEIKILADSEMHKTETIHFYSKQHKGKYSFIDTDGSVIESDGPMFTVDLPKHKYLYDFSVLLNNKPVKWKKSLSGNYITLNSDYQKDQNYIYTVKYIDANTAMYESSKSDKIELDLLNSDNFISIRHMNVNISLPDEISKENVKIDYHYNATDGVAVPILWVDDHHFSLDIANIQGNRFILKMSFPKGALGEYIKHTPLVKRKKQPFIESTNIGSLIYWQFTLLLIYLVFLYYYARSNGSFGAMGSISVRYNPPDNMSLMQSGFIIDEKSDIGDITAAIIELASLGFLKIVDNRTTGGSFYLKQIRKSTDNLTNDQKYILNRVLFNGYDVYKIEKDKRKLYEKFHRVDRKIKDWLMLNGYLYFDVKRARNLFLIKAFLTAMPILLFFTYSTFLIYGPDFAIIMIMFMFFFIGSVIFGAFTRNKNSFQGAIAIYFMLLVPYIALVGSYKAFLTGPIVVLPVITLMIIYFDRKISRLTGKGLRAYRDLLGYKEFIERTELPKLKYLLKEHPDHIEKSLSYTLLFKMMSHKLQTYVK